MTRPIDKAQLFRNAWSIARHTAMGLDLTQDCARQFFGAALRRAWVEARAEVAPAPAKPTVATIRFHPGAGRNRSWLAKVTGKDAKFCLAREFLKGAFVYDNGPYNEFVIPLVEGEIYQDHTKDFWVVRAGELVEVSRWNAAEVASITARFA